jgi:DNA damage-inducible protein 1
LYCNVEVNGHKVKALVDSGAQATIMSPECADACGISRLVDTRFAGVARGVGTAKIIGRVHAAQIKIGNLHLPCSFTVMEGKSVEMLLGLDMLKRYQASIDLAKGTLIIQDEQIPFLGEADIPKEVEQVTEEPTIPGPAGTVIGQQSGVVVSSEGQQQASETASTTTHAPASAHAQPQPQAAEPSTPNVSPQHVEALMKLGADRAGAIQALQATGDNVDMAASILFFN